MEGVNFEDMVCMTCGEPVVQTEGGWGHEIDGVRDHMAQAVTLETYRLNKGMAKVFKGLLP